MSELAPQPQAKRPKAQLTCRGTADGVLTPELCAELIFWHTCTCTPGYRAGVSVATHLQFLQCNKLHGYIPVMKARARVREAVEAALGLEFQLLHEFTALTCWHPGSCINAHYDSNRPYLQQRAVSAICYLNTGGGKDFSGGDFVFLDEDELPGDFVEPLGGNKMGSCSG